MSVRRAETMHCDVIFQNVQFVSSVKRTWELQVFVTQCAAIGRLSAGPVPLLWKLLNLTADDSCFPPQEGQICLLFDPFLITCFTSELSTSTLWFFWKHSMEMFSPHQTVQTVISWTYDTVEFNTCCLHSFLQSKMMVCRPHTRTLKTLLILFHYHQHKYKHFDWGLGKGERTSEGYNEKLSLLPTSFEG